MGIRTILRTLFSSKAAKRHAKVGNPKYWQVKREFQIKFLKEKGLQPHYKLLDIGCGTLRGGIPIIRYINPGNYTGLESRAEVVSEAEKELVEQNLIDKNAKIIHSPVLRSIDLDDKFDYIWAFSVLFHMNDEVVDDCFELVSRHLAEGGVWYANANIGEGKKGAWEEFPVVWRTLEQYRSLAEKYDLKLITCGTLKDAGHVTGDQKQDKQTVLRISK